MLKVKAKYLLPIIISCVTFHSSCRKRETSHAPLSYTKQMAGKHMWVGSIYNYKDSSLHDTTFEAIIYSFDDSTIAYDKTIRPNIEFLTYIKNDAVNMCNIYAYYRVVYTNPSQAISDTVKYYYISNKITYYSDNPQIRNILKVHTH